MQYKIKITHSFAMKKMNMFKCSSCIVAWGIDSEIRTHDLGTDLHHL